MARLAYPDKNTLSQATKDILSFAPDINIFKMMGHCETLIAPFLSLGSSILTKTNIDPVLREIAIVRAAAHCKSVYEMRQHDAIAIEEGVTQQQVDALHNLVEDSFEVFTSNQQAIIQFTDEIIIDIKVSDATFDKVKAILPPEQIQELIIAIGFYSMVGRFLETLEVDLEEGDDIKVVQVKNVREVMASS